MLVAIHTAEPHAVNTPFPMTPDPYAGKPFLLAGSSENSAIARVAAMEDSKRVDIVDTIINLQVSCMFGKLIEQYRIDAQLHPDCAVLEMCARMYLAGRESVSAAATANA